MRFTGRAILATALVVLVVPSCIEAATQADVAVYVRDYVLGGSYGGATLWMTDTALDMTYVARDVDPAVPDIPFPYDLTWLVMIDYEPNAYWAHPCAWVFVNDGLTEHMGPLEKRSVPSVFSNSGMGPQVDFFCEALAPSTCQPVSQGSSTSGQTGTGKDCLYAVMISGGWDHNQNATPFKNDLGNMYKTLRKCGFPAANISTYYNNGASLDLDNADGDGNHSTGGDVTGAANKNDIKTKLESLCADLTPRDILLVFVSDHGVKRPDMPFDGIALWNNGAGKMTVDEVIQPSDLAAWTRNCNACRVYFILLVCHGGQFLGPLTGTGHENTAAYAAAGADECGYANGTGTDAYAEYLDRWDDSDPATATMNSMHNAVTGISSTPGTSEGSPGIGDHPLCECCEGSTIEDTTWGCIKALYH